VPLGDAYARRVFSLLELIDDLDAHEARFTARIATEQHNDRGYTAVQALPGIGPPGHGVRRRDWDVHRFTDPAHLCSWAGLTPKHREPFRRRAPRAHHQARQPRKAAVEAIQRHPAGTKIGVDRTRIEARRGKNIAKAAAARNLLTLVYYGLRDGHIRARTHSRAA
jgi:transposase